MSHISWAPDDFADPIKLLNRLETVPEDVWLAAGAERALHIFQAAATHVPAYKKFLAARHFQTTSVKDIGDFVSIPATDKAEYLRRYERAEMCWDGDLKGQRWIFSTTSGSTGEPYYFPRSAAQDQQYALSAELYLRTQFKIHERSTLYIVAFPMGAWIGGLFTYEALRRVAERGEYALSIITPGINKLEIIKAVQNLGHEFDQVIIGSYAPFLKDIIDDGLRMGLTWSDYNLGFIFSAEAFGEPFRDYIAKKTGLASIYTSTLNHYGTVDLGTMAHETPLAILIRRLASDRPALHESIFGPTSKVPTLAQYIPELFYFEDMDGDLICTAASGLPLVRYDLKDRGGVITLAKMTAIFADHGINLSEQVAIAGISETIWQLPFVYVYERSDLSVSFFAFQIYPESIKKALAASDLLEQLTGKFTMAVEFDGEGSQQFFINIELKPDTQATPQLQKLVSESVVQQLLKENSEYRRTHEEYAERVYPLIQFWPYEYPEFFKPGAKQQWTKK